MRCSKCNGMIIRDNDPWDGEGWVCINCGKRPRITPLGRFYAEQERSTEQYWPRHGKTPPTRRYD